jgi:hypothetical protein
MNALHYSFEARLCCTVAYDGAETQLGCLCDLDIASNR